MLSRRALLVSCATVLAPKVVLGREEVPDWPRKTVRLIPPYAAGSASDNVAHILTRRLSQVFGHEFVIEYRAGASGTLAAAEVASAPADGHTLLWATTAPIALAPALTKVPYDPIRDFAPISAVTTTPFALVVNSKLPVKTVSEFIAYLKSRPNQLAFADAGNLSMSRIAMTLFLHHSGAEMTRVSFAGNAPALSNTVSGLPSAMFAILANALPHLTNGDLKILALSSDKRVAAVPEIPTLAETGFPEMRITSWNGLMAPAGTPARIIDRIASEAARVVRDARFIENVKSYGLNPLGNKPEEFAEMISGDIRSWAQAITEVKLKMQ